MATFGVHVPYVGEALSVYKVMNDVFSSKLFSSERITRVSDDTASFSYSLPLGVFRLLLDGNIVLADQDFDQKISLFTLESKDRGGKGKLDAVIRMNVNDVERTIDCECDITTKGMLSRVELPMEKVLGTKLDSLLRSILDENESIIVYEVDSHEAPILEELVETISSKEKSQPLWIAIIRFPAHALMWPVDLIRQFFRAQKGK